MRLMMLHYIKHKGLQSCAGGGGQGVGTVLTFLTYRLQDLTKINFICIYERINTNVQNHLKGKYIDEKSSEIENVLDILYIFKNYFNLLCTFFLLVN